MSKFEVTTYGNKYEILKFPDHYVAVAVTVSEEAAGDDGIVPAGTILGGGVLLDDGETAAVATTDDGVSNAEGVLLNDVDVSYGDAPGAMLIHGFVDINKLPAEPEDEEIAALKQITFLE